MQIKEAMPKLASPAPCMRGREGLRVCLDASRRKRRRRRRRGKKKEEKEQKVKKKGEMEEEVERN